MFRQLALAIGTQLVGPADEKTLRREGGPKVFLIHPTRLAAYLEWAWANRNLALPERPMPFSEVPWPFRHDPDDSRRDPDIPRLPPYPDVDWLHLVYAYMIENTRAYEIFARVVREYVHGERLGIPSSAAAQSWLRATEELFFRDPPLFSITSVTSHIRPDLRAMRRNAYYRMFGMDLNHGTEENRPYPYQKPAAANRDFVATFEEFLREIWVGISNIGNSSGPNPTDPAAIAALARRLRLMLSDRRLQGNLSREEFFYVATMSWFHLTVEFNSAITTELSASANSEYERLRKIGARAGLPPHAMSENYFQLAEPMALILRDLETTDYNAATVPTLYNPAGGLQDELLTIITHWSLATGRDLKLKKA